MTDFLTRSSFFLNSPAKSFILIIILLLSACSVHKIDIQQGNVITQEMFEKLKIGMEKKRVENILGTPLINDPFHNDRWDYVYIYKAGNTDERQSAHLVVYFENDLLNKIDVRSALPKETEVKKPGSTLRGGSSSASSAQPHSH